MLINNNELLIGAIQTSFPALLQFIIPDADKIFDLCRKPVFMNKEITAIFRDIERKGEPRFVDLLAKVFLLNGSERRILIHIEEDPKDSQSVAEEMFRYWYWLLDHYNIPVTAITLFTDKRIFKNRHVPLCYKREFFGALILNQYNALYIQDYNELKLLTMNNLFALVVLAVQKAMLGGKITEEELNEQRLVIARALIINGRYNREQIENFLTFLKQYIYIDNPEINKVFDREIIALTSKTNNNGILGLMAEEAKNEALKQGREEGKIAVIKNILETTDFTTIEIANFTRLPKTLIEDIKKSL
jgi:hypothetical protein